MKTIFGINFIVFCIVALTIVLYFTKEIRDEGFDINDKVNTVINDNLTKQGLINMTEL